MSPAASAAARLPSPEPPARASSFGELAFELRLVAEGECNSNNSVEHFLARYPNDALALVFKDLRRSAALVGEAATLLRSLAPFEREVRALLERNTSNGS